MKTLTFFLLLFFPFFTQAQYQKAMDILAEVEKVYGAHDRGKVEYISRSKSPVESDTSESHFALIYLREGEQGYKYQLQYPSGAINYFTGEHYIVKDADKPEYVVYKKSRNQYFCSSIILDALPFLFPEKWVKKVAEQKIFNVKEREKHYMLESMPLSIWVEKSTYRISRLREIGFSVEAAEFGDGWIYKDWLFQKQDLGAPVKATDFYPERKEGDIWLSEKENAKRNKDKQKTENISRVHFSFRCYDFLSGDTLHTDRFQQDVTVLYFWFIGCPGCWQSSPVLQELHSEWDPEKVLVLGVNGVDKERKFVQKYMEKYGLEFPVLADSEGGIARELQAFGSPGFVILDREGRVLFRQSGIHSPRRLKRVLKKEVDKRH